MNDTHGVGSLAHTHGGHHQHGAPTGSPRHRAGRDPLALSFTPAATEPGTPLGAMLCTAPPEDVNTIPAVGSVAVQCGDTPCSWSEHPILGTSGC